MELQKARKIMLALLGATALSLLIGAITASLVFALLGTILFFAFISYSFSHWRCPRCGEFLGWSIGKGIPFCPYCHQRMDK